MSEGQNESEQPPIAPPPVRLTISDDDLRSPGLDDRVQQLREAATPQVVRQVGVPDASTAKTNFLRGPVPLMAVAGIVGGFVGWLVAEVLMSPDSESAPFADNPTIFTPLWLTIFAIGLAGVLAAWEGIELRSREKAVEALKRTLPVTIGLALVGGFVAQTLFSSFVDSAVERAMDRAVSFEHFFDLMDEALRVPRAVAFLVAGSAVGAGLGLSSGAKQRAINGALGGALGGFIGGLAFSLASSGGSARAMAMTITGVAVGAGIALVEQARKDLWLEIVTGGMAGKQFIIYHDRTLLGASPHCGVTLIKDPGIAPEHAELVKTPRGTLIRAVGQHPVAVNGVAVGEHQLADGDQVQVGTTVLRFATKEQAMPTVREAF